MNHFLWKYKILIICIAGFVLVNIPDLSAPFVRHHDWNGVRYGLIARNYVRYGLLKTRLGQVENAGLTDPENFYYNTHYPPLLPLLIASSFKLFGETHFAARLIPFSASMASLFFLYLISKKLFNKSDLSLITVFLTFSTPMFVYFARIPTHEPVVLALSLGAIYYFLTYHYSISLILFTLACLTSWPAFVLGPLFFLRNKKLVFLLIPAVVFFSHLWHTQLLTGSPVGGGLVPIFLYRLNVGSDAAGTPFTMWEFVKRELTWIRVFFTWPIATLSAIWFIRNFKKMDFIFWILLVLGVWYPLVFRNIAFIHDYILYYLLPFIALSAAAVVNLTKRRLLAGLLIAIVSLVSQSKFLFALLQVHPHPGVELGQMEKNTPPARVAVPSKDFADQYERFVKYYSDKEIYYEP